MLLLALLLALPAAAQVKTGVDVLEAHGFKELRGKRVCLITNQTGIDAKGRSDVDALAEAKGVALACLFSPEHGFAGKLEKEGIGDASVQAGGRKIPVYSLYRGGLKGMKPLPEQLEGVDALVFDIQDVGARFYTYLATMALGMEAARDRGIEFVVLDRPDPIGGAVVEGPVSELYLEHRKTIPTDFFPVPVRHGLTAGEIAAMYARELGYGKLRVVRLEGWSRDMWLDRTGLPGWDADKTRRPSPNIPTLAAAALYPGVGIFETSNLSVGRGVDGSQFQLLGAPWLDAAAVAAKLPSEPLFGVAVTTETFTPGVNPEYPYYGKPCRGLRLTIVDRAAFRPLSLFVALARAIRAVHPYSLEWRGGGPAAMTGLRDFAELWKSDPELRELERRFDDGARAFAAARAPLLLYPAEGALASARRRGGKAR